MSAYLTCRKMCNWFCYPGKTGLLLFRLRKLFCRVFKMTFANEGLLFVSSIAIGLFLLPLLLLRRMRLCPFPVEAVKSLFHDSTSSPLIIAHRGAAAEAPENTLGAFRKAKENGALAVEFDVDFTKDGVAVIMHDETVDRTTNGRGKVGDFTLENIQELDASINHRFR